MYNFIFFLLCSERTEHICTIYKIYNMFIYLLIKKVIQIKFIIVVYICSEFLWTSKDIENGVVKLAKWQSFIMI